MKKIYILVMVLLVYASTVFAAGEYDYLSGNEKDVAASGEYEGMRMITNHKFVGEYEIYFNIANDGKDGGSISYTTPIVYVGNHDMQEVLTFVLDGVPYSAPRAKWYKTLSIVENNDKNNVLRRIVGEKFYNEYFAHRYGEFECQQIAKEYVEEVIFQIKPFNRYSTADITIN